MKLHEAIRLGSTMTKPIIGTYYLEIKNCGENDGEYACALGAAAIALGCVENQGVGMLLIPFPWLPEGREVICPQCGVNQGCVSMAVIHLNDQEHWTREQIADWVQGVENDLDRRQRRSETERVGLPDAVTCPDTELVPV